MFGKTKQGKQRYRCLECNKTFVWKKTYNKKYKEQHWFKLWIIEGYSIRQLSNISGHSQFKLKLIKNYWLSKSPNQSRSKIDLSQVKYLAFDGTYFKKNSCLIIFFDIIKKQHLCFEYVKNENYLSVKETATYLKTHGLNPTAITVDGNKQIIKAIKEIWPKIIIQRCLFHIKLQGQMWLRAKPKTEAGKVLKIILSKLMNVKDNDDKNTWINQYFDWQNQYSQEIMLLSKTSIAAQDLKRTMALINNALPDMFYFIKDQKIAATTNLLENFFSILKRHYKGHRGLSESHKIAYLKWFCYYKNQAK